MIREGALWRARYQVGLAAVGVHEPAQLGDEFWVIIMFAAFDVQINTVHFHPGEESENNQINDKRGTNDMVWPT